MSTMVSRIICTEHNFKASVGRNVQFALDYSECPNCVAIADREYQAERTGEYVDVDYAATLLTAIDKQPAALSRAIVATLNDPYEEANRRAWANITRPVE